jgi:hypothetical protein
MYLKRFEQGKITLSSLTKKGTNDLTYALPDINQAIKTILQKVYYL